MTKPSVSEASGSPQHSARDAHGNQSHGDGSVSAAAAASSATASREIFQGLFKDLGKQAMAMESILRLVCGKVDKLEHWVTEMSYGMTELDHKLRNIAHNIEGTAANVDDVASVSRWAEPVEENPLDAKAATATVIKKVGVGLNGKKKQMRMTGMVANILDQLTAVAETPVMVESENESHKGEDGGKKKKGKKAKDKDKEKAKGDYHTMAGGGTGVVAASKDHSPREAEAKTEVKEKQKHHKKKKAESQQPPQPHEEKEKEAEGKAEEHEEVNGQAEVVEPEKVEEKEVQQLKAGKHDTQEDRKDESASQDEEMAIVAEGEEVSAEYEPGQQVDVAENVEVNATKEEELSELAPVEEQSDPEQTESASMIDDPATNLIEAPAQSAQTLQAPAETVSNSQVSAEPASTPVDTMLPSSPAPDAVLSSRSDTAPLPHVVEIPVEEQLLPMELVEQVSTPSPPPGSPPLIAEVVVPVAASPSQPTTAVETMEQQPPTPATHSDLPTIHLEPLVIPETTPLIQQTPVTNTEPTPEASTTAPQPTALLTKAGSKKLRNKNALASTDATDSDARLSPTKKGSRKASIRQSISKRQPSLKKRRSQNPAAEVPAVEDTALETTVSSTITVVVQAPVAKTTAEAANDHDNSPTNEQNSQEEGSQEEDDDDDDDEDSNSMLSSDSDGSVLDLGGGGSSGTAADIATNATAADKKMSSKLTRTLSALDKLKKANVLSPDEIAELKDRANQKWFRLRDHVKEKNKKDVTNILLKRKKNIFTVSNRIELLEEKSREVYASLKQLNTELKGKIEASTFESLRRHVHDVHASLQVLDQKVSKGDIPSMANLKQLASETENLRVMFLEQLAFARDHCDANHQETLRMFEEEWTRVTEIETSMKEKLATLAAGFDAKILALPDYADALEGIRRAVRKKADLKVLRELEAKLLGHEAESEDCLIRCLSCHKEVVNANGHDTTNNAEDMDASVANSPHFKRVNPGTTSAKVYRSNMPLNAQPLMISESAPELFGVTLTEEATTPNAKSATPSRRVVRNEEPRPSPLSFIHVTATRAMAAASDSSRPISAPSVTIKKKTQPKSTQ